jgi:DUF1365 family protein
MESCLYEGSVRHRRRAPVEHAFSLGLYLVYLDLAELGVVFRGSWLWSTRRPAFSWFRRRDHLGDPARPLDACVRDLVAQETGRRPTGPVRLLTQLRTAGYAMNPVSFYYCFDGTDARVESVVVEVNNTPWGEQHCYVLGALERDPDGALCAREPKVFHVSPFMEMERAYRFAFSKPGARLRLQIRSEGASDAAPFDASLSLERRPLGARQRARVLLRYPLATLRVSAAIYWQALRLWRKGSPFHPHPGAAEPLLETRP